MVFFLFDIPEVRIKYHKQSGVEEQFFSVTHFHFIIGIFIETPEMRVLIQTYYTYHTVTQKPSNHNVCGFKHF